MHECVIPNDLDRLMLVQILIEVVRYTTLMGKFHLEVQQIPAFGEKNGSFSKIVEQLSDKFSGFGVSHNTRKSFMLETDKCVLFSPTE